MEHYENRFTNLALYRRLARFIQELHRDAYTGAVALARSVQRTSR
jgi:hypothetical protein